MDNDSPPRRGEWPKTGGGSVDPHGGPPGWPRGPATTGRSHAEPQGGAGSTGSPGRGTLAIIVRVFSPGGILLRNVAARGCDLPGEHEPLDGRLVENRMNDPLCAIRRMGTIGVLVGVACLSCARDGSNAKAATKHATQMTDCAGGKLDPATNLCWENPPSEKERTWPDAKTYCDDLDLGGHTDWRLPDIDELISLLKGCQDGTATRELTPSRCAVTERMYLLSGDPAYCYGWIDLQNCWARARCRSCRFGAGPGGEHNLYMDPALTAPRLPVLTYWSSTSHELRKGEVWVVVFDRGHTYYHDESYRLQTRCVRGGS